MKKSFLLLLLIFFINSSQANIRFGGGIALSTGLWPTLVIDGNNFTFFTQYYKSKYELEGSTPKNDNYIYIAPFYKHNIKDGLNALLGINFHIYSGDSYDSRSDLRIETGFEKKISENFSFYGTFPIYQAKSEKKSGGTKKTYTNLFPLTGALIVSYFF
jgi:hypothetical protein